LRGPEMRVSPVSHRGPSTCPSCFASTYAPPNFELARRTDIHLGMFLGMTATALQFAASVVASKYLTASVGRNLLSFSALRLP